MISLVVLALVSVHDAPPPASVDAALPTTTVMALDVGATYRVGATRLSDMRVDGNGALYGQEFLVDHRLSLAPTLTLRDRAKIVSELQVAAGYLRVDEPAGSFGSFGPPRDE